jgi:D-alanyl-D-alanine carboxypeptidase/D-alanyl-D-alanine-endopeptidase (penicillin-binding protein 4)
MSDLRITLSRRLFLAGMLAGTADIALATAPAASLRPKERPGEPGPRMYASAESLVDRAKLGNTKVAFVVADAATGEILEAMNPMLALPPASTAKALTAIYALETLGPAHRFSTRLIGTGPVVDGVLNGDLVLVGSGDPTLDTTALALLAQRLADAGIGSVEGQYLIWDGALPTQTAIDIEQPVQVGYNPAVSGLNLNFNRVHFEWRKAGAGWTTTMQARSDSHRPDVRVARMTIDQRRYPIYTYSDDGTADLWTVASGALGQDGARWLPVRKPAAYTAEVFQSYAEAQGIALSDPVPVAALPAGETLADVESEDLRSLLRDMLKYSTNLTAEAVGLASTAAWSGPPDSLAQSAAMMSAWFDARLGSQQIALVDHSGLGGASRITPLDMVRALVQLGPGVDLEPILKPVSMKDSKGRPVPDHPVTIMAKTGTLNFVSALAGYASLPDGRKLVFATIVADVPRRDAIPVEQRERPEGVRSWTARARTLQIRLIDRWSTVYVVA